jgi:DNA-binding NtrC family response regulator
MRTGGGECVNAAEGGGVRDFMKVLGICLSGGGELGGELESVLQPVRNLELVRKSLPEGDSVKCSSILRGLVAELTPNLLLVCLGRESSAHPDSVFEAIRQNLCELPIIVLLEKAAADELHRFIRMGAADFCIAPLRLEDLLPRMLRWSVSISKVGAFTRQLEQTLGLQQFHGESRAFLEALNRIPKLARCDASVLITGETGTGKEMCARAIHHLGPRCDHPFVPVNCGAIPSELVENELFGHEAGAFTGASSGTRGLIHDAEGGTLFLDEIDSLPLQTQVKFLRFLQDREYRPLGSRKSCRADIRIIAASNSDLVSDIGSGRFRPDLFYRLNVLPLKLPALRDRREDIPPLARHFLGKYTREFSMPMRDLSRTALEKLLAYEWPGNVRELENIIERAIVLSEQPLITGEDICVPQTSPSAEEMSFKALKAHAIAEFETAYVRRLLVLNDGNISKAARAAKKNRRAFWQLMRKHDIPSPVTLVASSDIGQIAANARINLS